MDKQLKVFEAFAGYGSQSMALERLKKSHPGFDYQVVGISEIDMNANDDIFTDFHGNVLLSEEGKEQRCRKGKPISRTAQYKLAGNSIVTACLENIFEQLFYPETKQTVVKQLSLF